MPSLYKVLGPAGRSINGGDAVWHLPSGRRPGKWMPAVAGAIYACETGYHLAEIAELLNWIRPGSRIYSSEGRGDSDRVGTTIAYRQARLLRRLTWDDWTARRFAADCAAHVLPLFEAQYPEDDRPRRAIEVARRYAEGLASDEELAAARDAVRVAWNAARVAWNAAMDAAWDAARDAARAAGDAAGAAARDAAWDAERAWQHERLAAYLEGRQDA